MRSLLRNGRFAARSGQVLVALLAIALQVSTAGAVNERFLGNLQVGEHFEIGSAGKSAPRLLDSVDYSNVSNFLGQGSANGGSELQGTNRITRLVADDILPDGQSGFDVIEITFSVANFNAVPVTVRPRIRFWFDNAGAPGAYYNIPSNVGFSFNPLTFTPGVTLVTGSIGPGLFSMPGGKFWAGITFDDNNGTTGATQAQLDMMGQGMFDPADIGSSDNLAFSTTGAGSFFGVSNPPGSTFSFGQPGVASFGWEFISSAPTPTTKSSWGRIKNLYR